MTVSYTHLTSPAVTEYNKTTESANKTVASLMKILKAYKVDDTTDDEEDPLLRILNGSDVSE